MNPLPILRDPAFRWLLAAAVGFALAAGCGFADRCGADLPAPRAGLRAL